MPIGWTLSRQVRRHKASQTLGLTGVWLSVRPPCGRTFLCIYTLFTPSFSFFDFCLDRQDSETTPLPGYSEENLKIGLQGC